MQRVFHKTMTFCFNEHSLSLQVGSFVNFNLLSVKPGLPFYHFLWEGHEKQTLMMETQHKKQILSL